MTTASHFVTVNENVMMYKANQHQHLPAIMQQLQRWQPSLAHIQFTTSLLPINRGIFVSAYVKLKQPLTPAAIHALYHQTYADKPFVRLMPLDTLPAIKQVVGTNFTDIGLTYNPITHYLTIVSVLDNMIKGAAGQDSIHASLPMLTGFTYAKFNDIASVKALITDDTAAIMLELVQGEGGVFPADPAFVAELVALAQTNGILLLVDEVQTGMGRTGTRFAFEQYGFTPDIFTTAKGLANGIPVGAMLAKNEFAPALAYGTHGSTFGGNPLAMSAAQATLTVLDDVLPTLPEKIALFWDKLAEFKTLAVVDDVRGLGMMAGIALTVPVEQVVTDLLAAHIIVLSAGHNTLRLLPPLTIPTAQLLETLDNIKIQLDKI